MDYRLETTAKLYRVEAGMLERGAVRRFLKEQALIQRPGFMQYTESWRLLSSAFLIRLEGPRALVDGWIAATNDLLRDAYEEE